MSVITQNHILNIVPGMSAPVVVHVSQGDSGVELEFVLVNGSEIFDPTGTVISVHGIRQDGTGWGPVACAREDGKIKFTLPDAATAVKGSGMAEVVISNESETVGTTNFAILVETATFPQGVTYANDVSVYEAILAYVQNMGEQTVANVEADLAAEIANRQAADAVLQQNINTEASTRAGADTTLQTNLNNAVSSLNEALAHEVSARESAVSGEASTRASADSLINTRIDEIIAPSGEAPSAAEVNDARIGADGVTYPTLGDAIRTQVGNLNDEQTNQLYLLEFEQGNINTTGGKVASTTRVRTVTKITTPMHIETLNTDIIVVAYFIYNNDGSFVSYTTITNSTKVDVNPASGTYALVVFTKRDNSTFTPNELQPLVLGSSFNGAVHDSKENTKALLRTTDITDAFQIGKLINNSVSLNSVITLTPTTNSGFACYSTACVKGDVFKITGKGGSTGRLWSFADVNVRQLAAAASGAEETALEVTAPEDGYFTANVNIANPYTLEVTRRVSVSDIADNVDENTSDIADMKGEYHLTNPHYLSWRMGTFTASGPQGYAHGMLPTDRFFTIVKVKAGSKVSKKSGYSHTKRIFFGYKLSESDATLSGYTSNAGDSVTIAQDCIAYIGVLYENPVEDLLDDTILDELDFDLHVVDYKSRYSNTDSFTLPYGNPCPEIYYEGQHTDITGWNLYTSDIDEIHDAFDALCTDSDGYLSQVRDYGIVYTGNAGNSDYDPTSDWHIYEYQTNPSFDAFTKIPKIAITCGVHGNEKMSVYAMHYLMYDLIHNSTKNPVLSYLKANCRINFLPMCNPYGFMKAIPARVNESGVNLNRNFPTYNWSTWDGDGNVPGGQNYKGTSAASETETKAIMKFYRNNYDAVIAIDLHTDGADTSSRDQISSYMPTEPQDPTDKNYDILHSYLAPGKVYTNKLKPWLNEKYDAGMGYDLLWGAVGAMDYYPSCPHWVRETAGEVGQCYEVMAGSSTQFIGSQLTQYSADTIKAAAEELGNFLITIINHCKIAK